MGDREIKLTPEEYGLLFQIYLRSRFVLTAFEGAELDDLQERALKGLREAISEYESKFRGGFSSYSSNTTSNAMTELKLWKKRIIEEVKALPSILSKISIQDDYIEICRAYEEDIINLLNELDMDIQSLTDIEITEDETEEE